MVSLESQADAYARSLSGGMKRRLLIAKAMVHRPPILVLDEPTAGVDVQLRKNLWDNVKALNKKGVTIILTTHLMYEAEKMCNRIAIINKGNLIKLDTTENLLNTIKTKKIQ
jgi:ABC-2 type transport system ATP-binding protein